MSAPSRAAGHRLDKNGGFKITPQKLGLQIDIGQTEFGQGVVFEFIELESIVFTESDIPVQTDANVFELTVNNSLLRDKLISVVLYR